MKHVVHALKLLSLIAIIILFTACNKVGVQASSTDLGSLSVNQMDAVTATTKKNISVSFSAGKLSGQYIGNLSLSTTPGTTMLKTPNGTLQIVDPLTFGLKYTPDEYFVGVENVKVYATDRYGAAIPGDVTITVGNTLNSIQPALAVRGMSCITCHSSVSSNIVTDYGFGNSWYFDTSTNDSFYFDRLGVGNGLATLNLLNNSSIIVPQAPVPAAIQSQFNVSSLADFVKARFAQGSPNQAAQVKEVASLKINIPSLGRIQQLFGNPTSNNVYIPDTQNSPALSGANFDSVNGVFKITNLVCDGDLYLGAPVIFENAQVSSIAGCRIYTSASVFIDGNLQSIPYLNSTKYNTQILSAESIWVGAGHMSKGGVFCEKSGNTETGWYAGRNCATTAANSAICDSFSEREANIVSRNTFSVAYPDNTSLKNLMKAGGAIDRERAAVEASLGSALYDLSCRAGGRALDMSRLMLVAPYVNDRSTGDFSGSVIAESALTSLGTFKFQFDPVFTSTSIFSLLDSDELVSGQGL